jgi:hypothetical protein
MTQTTDQAFAQRARAIADEERNRQTAERKKAKAGGAANGGSLPTLQAVLDKAPVEVRENLRDAVRQGRRIDAITSLCPPGFEPFAEACIETEATSLETFALGVVAIAKAAGGLNAVSAEHVARGADHHRWENLPAIRAEFRSEPAYLAFQEGVRAGRIRGGRQA